MARTIATLITLAAVCFLAIEGGLLLRETRIDADKLTGEVQGWNRGVWNTLGDTSAAMKTVAQIGAKERDAFSTQQAYYAQLTTHTNAVLEDADATIKTVDDMVLPKVGGVLDRTGDTVVHVGASADFLASETTKTLESVAPGIDGFNRAMTDPAIHDTLIHIDDTSANISYVTDDVHTETSLIVGKTREAFAPKNKFLSILQAFGGGTLTVAELFYYLRALP